MRSISRCRDVCHNLNMINDCRHRAIKSLMLYKFEVLLSLQMIKNFYIKKAFYSFSEI